jgi:hypothetical protein
LWYLWQSWGSSKGNEGEVMGACGLEKCLLLSRPKML